MNKIFKAIFFVFTALYLFSLVFDGILLRQITTVLLFIMSLISIAVDKSKFSVGNVVGVLALVLLFAITALISPNDDWKLKVFFVFSGVTFLLFSYALFTLDYKNYFMHFLVIACVIIIVRFLIVQDENLIFYHASRNIVATFVLFPVICCFLFMKKSSSLLALAFLTIFMCFLLKGRTALLLSLVIMCVALYRAFGIKVLTVIILFSSPIFFYLNFNEINESIAAHTNFSEGLKTTRSVIYDEYFSNFSLADFVFGRSFDGMMIINTLNNNPHNSFLLIHSLFGFLPAFFLLLMFFIASLMLFFRYGFIAALLFLLIPIKAMTDSVIFFNILDVFYMLPLMFLFIRYKAESPAVSIVTDYK
ncbi:hypothetical protein ACMS09_000308 [Cronobacter malonaticus]|uniref:Wzy n=1 Tax=Cronobacter turicensis TaxID=413502 RepID=I7DGV7_9ENTR|nr:Wzy [Cronobacter turicensis]